MLDTTKNWEIRSERAQDAVHIAALLDESFGAGRFAKSAYRLREGRPPVAALSFVAVKEEVLAGSVRFWPVLIGAVPALLLGPIAVNSKFRGAGAAVSLIEHSCIAAKKLEHQLVILVGDLEYYSRTGFKQLIGEIKFPAPVDYARVLVRPLVEGAEKNLYGAVSAPTNAAAKFCGYESAMMGGKRYGPT